MNRTKNRLINLSIVVANFFYYFDRKSSSFRAYFLRRRVNGRNTHPTTKTQVGVITYDESRRDNITVACECKDTNPARDSSGGLSIRHDHNIPAFKRQDTPAFQGERTYRPPPRKTKNRGNGRGNGGKGKGPRVITMHFFLWGLTAPLLPRRRAVGMAVAMRARAKFLRYFLCDTLFFFLVSLDSIGPRGTGTR
jgi:hypothetical protein